MNVERILALADLIEQQPHATENNDAGFYMGLYVRDCGTPACIAGWAVWESLDRCENIWDHFKTLDNDAVVEAAENYLGLGERQASRLFLMVGINRAFSDVLPSEAAATLRHLAATGEVDWSAKATGSVLDAGNAA